MNRIAGKPSINIPFPGFYESILSSEIDSVEAQNAESDAERQESEGVPEELRLTAERFEGFYFDCTDYSKVHDRLASDWVDEFDGVASEALGVKLRLRFEDMSSPKYYNFETDRIFAASTWKAVKAMFKLSKTDKHETLAAVIKRRFTSRSGFISYYSSDLDDWLKKPVREWDYNELGTLLLAALQINGIEPEDLRMKVYYRLAENGHFYNAVDAAVDFTKFNEKIREEREELIAKQRERDPTYEAPYRCPDTPDLFAERRPPGRAGHS
jgi:hypothetical protein